MCVQYSYIQRIVVYERLVHTVYIYVYCSYLQLHMCSYICVCTTHMWYVQSTSYTCDICANTQSPYLQIRTWRGVSEHGLGQAREPETEQRRKREERERTRTQIRITMNYYVLLIYTPYLYNCAL